MTVFCLFVVLFEGLLSFYRALSYMNDFDPGSLMHEFVHHHTIGPI